MNDTDRELTEQERQALDAWSTAEPPAGIGARIVARMHAEADVDRRQGRQRQPRRPALLGVAVAAGLLVATAGSVLYLAGGGVLEGVHESARRTTLAIGRRAVAVAEADAALSWRVDRRGSRVTQHSGNVFYRVEHGAPFVVHTPHGEVRVLGTCFRVEVTTMRATRAGMLGAASGAALATVVLVSVYEGKVLTANAGGRQALGAGERAALDDEQRAPRALAQGDTAGHGQLPAESRRADEGRAQASQGKETLAEVQADRKRLAGELDALKARLAQSQRAAAKTRTYDIPKDELVAMAGRCELRWDLPSIEGHTAPTVSRQATKELGLNQTEIEAINKVFADNQKLVTTQLRKLYVEVTGDTKASESLSPAALVEEVRNKSPKDELRSVFQRLAQERAGLVAAPADITKATAAERLYRLLTSNGDQVERAIGASIGPDLARRLRDVHEGFGSRSRSSYGCPPRTP